MLKCQIVHLGRSNAGHKYKLGQEWLESSPAERNLGALVESRLSLSAVCPGSQEGKPHPGVHQTQHSQLVKNDYLAVFSTGVASPGVLCAVLGPTV